MALPDEQSEFSKTSSSRKRGSSKLNLPLIACACSGGVDSMAMTFLLAQEHPVIALIVDHSLRKESKSEAARTKKILTKLKIKSEILTYKGKKPEANIQEEARNIRYKLLIDYCKKHKIKTLATAHNAEDNAETFLLRLSRGSGVDGLAAIPAEAKMNGIKIIRPVMNQTRKELKKVLTDNKIEWVDDPTNATDKYRRNKLRLALSKLENAELTTKRINEAANNLSRVRDYLEKETEKALKQCFNKNELDMALFGTLHEEIQYRLLNLIIIKLSQPAERPRFESLKHLKLELENGKTRTLSGLLFKVRKGKIVIDIEK
jgi:tRNA(Ile)-lysidine synthase